MGYQEGQPNTPRNVPSPFRVLLSPPEKVPKSPGFGAFSFVLLSKSCKCQKCPANVPQRSLKQLPVHHLTQLVHITVQHISEIPFQSKFIVTLGKREILIGGERHLVQCPQIKKEQPASQICGSSAAWYALRYLADVTDRAGGGSVDFATGSLLFLREKPRQGRLNAFK